MSRSGYTTNNGIQKWVDTDKPVMNDFNGMIDEVDSAISEKADQAATYTKTEVDTALENKVNKDGSTSITGDQTAKNWIADNNTSVQSLTFKRNGAQTGRIYCSSDFETIVLEFNISGGGTKSYPFNSTAIDPVIDNERDIGSPISKFKDGYIGSIINTSDERQKDISALDEVKDFFLALNPIRYRFKDGTSGRMHYGLGAREVEMAMAEKGLTDMDFAGLIKASDEENEGEHIYGLRYSEFIPMLIKMVQEQQKRIEVLESK